MVLGFAELMEEDRPPKEIYLDDEALVDHFALVEQRRKDKREGVETIPGIQNDLTKDIKRR